MSADEASQTATLNGSVGVMRVKSGFGITAAGNPRASMAAALPSRLKKTKRGVSRRSRVKPDVGVIRGGIHTLYSPAELQWCPGRGHGATAGVPAEVCPGGAWPLLFRCAMADRWSYTTRWRVRQYELDYNGHVSNAMYLNWVAQVTSEHGEASGFGRAWSLERGGMWVVRRHAITYHRPATLADELELTVRVRSVGGVRGTRETSIIRISDQAPVADVETEWVWVRLTDGRPTRVPREIIDAYSDGEPASAG
jgi:acyl-CoA thioester hydrolase